LKILLLDLETAPNQAYVWGLWQQNVGIDQIVRPGYTLCWAAKWLGEKELHFNSLHQSKPKKMIKEIYDLVDQADAVVHYNGTKFDMPTLNKEFILHGFTPPSPYKQIDLLRTARSQFRFPSNKLDYIAQALGLGSKVRHKGMALWTECMAGEDQAWKEMETYNRQDVLLLEKLYYKLLPWIKGHANHSLYSATQGVCCTNCGSTHFQRRGSYYTQAGVYSRLRCNDCGTWFKTGSSEAPKPADRSSTL
jgi:hypothetical protein